MRQAAVGGPFPEHFDRFVAVRVGYPERRPLRVQGRHIKTITPAGAVLPWFIFKIAGTLPLDPEITIGYEWASRPPVCGRGQAEHGSLREALPGPER